MFSIKAAFLEKTSIFSRKSSIFYRKSSIFPQNLYKFDLGFSGGFSVARLGFSSFLEWQHWSVSKPYDGLTVIRVGHSSIVFFTIIAFLYLPENFCTLFFYLHRTIYEKSVL